MSRVGSIFFKWDIQAHNLIKAVGANNLVLKHFSERLKDSAHPSDE